MAAPQQQIIELAPDTYKQVIEALHLSAKPLIILLGDVSEELKPQMRAICRRVIAPLAVNPGALIIDNATCAGCAAVVGQASQELDTSPTVVGIVSHDTRPETIDPNHPLILRLAAEWADPVKYSFQIADLLVKGTADRDQPALAILFGGAELETRALIRCGARAWPVVAIQGTGGLADRIIDATTSQPDGTPPNPPKDPELREIFDNVDVYPFRIDGSMDDLSAILLGRIDQRGDRAAIVIKDSWGRFDRLDQAAGRSQKLFRHLELTLIYLAVVAAAFAVLKSGGAVPQSFKDWAHSFAPQWITLHAFVIVVPVLISIIGAYNSHFRDGYKWILLRGGAEAMKREIYRFLTRSGVYSDQQCYQTSRESKLTARMKDITAALEHSEVNKMNVKDADLAGTLKAKPALGNFLTPEDYLEYRISDQIRFFQRNSGRLSRRLVWLQVSIYLAGGAGTLLAAFRRDVWVAVATAVVTALATKLQTDQVENTLVQYNQALTALRNIQSWWQGLSNWERSRRRNIDVLVDQTERTLESETAGWVQQMQSALEKLTEKEPAGART
ncbi:MAG TPA: DUF4231 domain-containing protein [Bryobacteraceae bacterium]|nr:DUF4231 domain-containing protein [Bryobacteraceae bacterium]